MDTATSAEIVQMMFAVNRDRGTTFVIITPNPEVDVACDHPVVMRDGAMVDIGDLAPENRSQTGN
ncbi:MAG: hypothetical protein Q7V14_03560 [Coriobacteriia bacterium]|nr:hypothetical protein [Coriobacteriia bacterium]